MSSNQSADYAREVCQLPVHAACLRLRSHETIAVREPGAAGGQTLAIAVALCVEGAAALAAYRVLHLRRRECAIPCDFIWSLVFSVATSSVCWSCTPQRESSARTPLPPPLRGADATAGSPRPRGTRLGLHPGCLECRIHRRSVGNPARGLPAAADPAPLVWEIETVDSEGNTGWRTSLALDSAGRPHISYQGYGLDYARAVGPCAPVGGAAFTWAPPTPTVGLAVAFTGSASGTPVPIRTASAQAPP